jgi:hypothetical protein
MLSFLDKTFCKSPNCTNQCGRKMTPSEKERLRKLDFPVVCYAYFCGVPEELNDDARDSSALAP